MRRRLAEPNIARDDRVVDEGAECRPHIGSDLRREIVATIVHREHDALNAQIRVEGLAHRLNRAHELREPFEREELALQRHEDRVGGETMALIVSRLSDGGQSIMT
jgi:hypothetical protein